MVSMSLDFARPLLDLRRRVVRRWRWEREGGAVGAEEAGGLRGEEREERRPAREEREGPAPGGRGCVRMKTAAAGTLGFVNW